MKVRMILFIFILFHFDYVCGFFKLLVCLSSRCVSSGFRSSHWIRFTGYTNSNVRCGGTKCDAIFYLVRMRCGLKGKTKKTTTRQIYAHRTHTQTSTHSHIHTFTHKHIRAQSWASPEHRQKLTNSLSHSTKLTHCAYFNCILRMVAIHYNTNGRVQSISDQIAPTQRCRLKVFY